MAVNIGFVMLAKIRALEHKACDLPTVELDILKVTAHAYKKRTPEYVCGLKTGIQLDHPLS